MAGVGPSTRFRSIALTVLAAGGVFLPVAALAVGSLGLFPTQSTAQTVDPAMSSGQAAEAAYGASGILPQNTELDAALLRTIVQAREPGADRAVTVPPGGLTIPAAALAAYRRAESALALQQPTCKLSWTLLAGLGRVLSDHGSGSLDPSGNSIRPILGPRLDGSPGLANIRDTDAGQLDTDTEWDRAVGPMQIIPTVWRRVGGDSDGDGYGSPHNIFDSALAAGRYLCEGDVNLADVTEQAEAVFRYQRSDLFVRAVMAWSQAYSPQLVSTPAPGPVAPGPVLPPVEKIPAPAKIPPPPGVLPRGEPQAPVSVLPPPSRSTGAPPAPPGPPPGPMPPAIPPGPTPPPPPPTPPPPPSTTTPPPTTTTPSTPPSPSSTVPTPSSTAPPTTTAPTGSPHRRPPHHHHRPPSSTNPPTPTAPGAAAPSGSEQVSGPLAG